MQTGRRVLRNMVSLTLATGLDKLVGFVLTVYIARVLGADALGHFSIVWSLLLIFQTVSLLGQEPISIREVARNPGEAGAYLANGSLVVLGGGLLGAPVMLATAYLLRFEPQVLTYACMAGLALIPGVLSVVAQSVILGLEQMHFVTVARAASGVIKLVLSLSLLYSGVGLWSVFLVIALSNASLYGIYLWILKRLTGRLVFRPDRQLIRWLLRKASTFTVISIFAVVFKQVDVLILGKMREAAEVGFYTAAFRLIQVGMQVQFPLMQALFPRMSEVFTRSPDRLATISRRTMKALLVIVLPVAVAGTLLSERIVVLFYGEGYERTVIVLRLLVWMLALSYTNAVLYRTMLASDNERLTMRVAGVNMVASVSLNLILIRPLGAVGVAVTAISTLLIAVTQNYVYIRRHLFKLNWFRLVGKPAVAAALFGGLVFALRSLPLAASLSVGGVVYVALIFALKVFSASELSFVQTIWASLLRRNA